MKKEKKMLILLMIMFISLNITAVMEVKSQSLNTIYEPNFGIYPFFNLTSRYYISEFDRNPYRSEGGRLIRNPVYGLRARQVESEWNAVNNLQRRQIGMSLFHVPKNSFEREAMAYSTIIQVISNDNTIRYEHWLQFRLISLNASHVGVNFIHGRYMNGGSWGEYVNTILYIPIQSNFYTFELIFDTSVHYINGYKHSINYFIIFYNEDGSKFIYNRYMNSAGLDWKEFYIEYTFQRNSLPVQYSDPEVSYILYTQRWGHETWYNENGFYPTSWYLENSIYERIGGANVIIETPSADKYWTYQSFELENHENSTLYFVRNYTIYNETLNTTTEHEYSFNYTFSRYRVKNKLNYFYYSDKMLKSQDFGNWKTFNFVRDSLIFTINSIIFIFQAIMYLLIIAFNYLIVWLGLQIIILLWNYPIYWIVFGFIGIVFYLSFFFVWLWNQAIILWKMVIEPIFNWVINAIVNWVIENIWNPIKAFFENGGLKILFDFYMIILSYIIAFLLWVLTFGTQDFATIQQTIQMILLAINQSIFEFIAVFLENFVWLALSALYYILLVGLVYVKYIYAKSRGYVQRASRLQSMINVYKLPLVLVARIVSYIIGFIQGGLPTDGSQDK